MVNKIISDLENLVTIVGDEVIPLENGTGTFAATIDQIADFANEKQILDSSSINNLGLAASVAANALTIALKTKAGTDPAVIDPVKISFRNATLTTGTYNTRSSTAATSLVVSSGSTLGTVSAVASTMYIYALDNAGTIELGISSTL